MTYMRTRMYLGDLTFLERIGTLSCFSKIEHSLAAQAFAQQSLWDHEIKIMLISPTQIHNESI